MVSSIAILEGPDFIVLAMILLVLGGLPAIAVAIIFLLKRRQNKPPLIPTAPNATKE